jgi:Flagellar hook-length control protein FliK
MSEIARQLPVVDMIMPSAPAVPDVARRRASEGQARFDAYMERALGRQPAKEARSPRPDDFPTTVAHRRGAVPLSQQRSRDFAAGSLPARDGGAVGAASSEGAGARSATVRDPGDNIADDNIADDATDETAAAATAHAGAAVALQIPQLDDSNPTLEPPITPPTTPPIDGSVETGLTDGSVSGAVVSANSHPSAPAATDGRPDARAVAVSRMQQLLSAADGSVPGLERALSALTSDPATHANAATVDAGGAVATPPLAVGAAETVDAASPANSVSTPRQIGTSSPDGHAGVGVGDEAGGAGNRSDHPAATPIAATADNQSSPEMPAVTAAAGVAHSARTTAIGSGGRGHDGDAGSAPIVAPTGPVAVHVTADTDTDSNSSMTTSSGADPAVVASRGEHSAGLRASFEDVIASADAKAAAQLDSAQLGTTRAARGTHESISSMALPQLSIDLSDEGLGPLTLQAASGTGGLHVTLTAGDRAVGEALARAGSELRRELEADGTTLGSLDIGHADQRGSGGAPGQSGWSTDDRQPARPHADPVAAPAHRQSPLNVSSAMASRRSDANGLDVLI